jgi:hypothetical protein
MSGFEVIGLVLAIVPIFEAASGPTARGLEHTRTAFSSSRAGSKREDPRMIPAIEDRLGVGYKTFELHITKLLEQLDKLVTKDETVKLSTLKGVPVEFNLRITFLWRLALTLSLGPRENRGCIP